MDQRRPTISQDIMQAIQRTQTKLSDREHMSLLGSGESMDECYPGLYIGNLSAAEDKALLQKVGITHVLNTAQGNKFFNVDTNAQYYADVGIKYLGMRLMDVATANIAQYFDSGADFIDEALSSGGKVLVHCFMGISRSATISCAYLMIKKQMSAVEAIETLRKHRSIYPNDGFISQLADLDNKLRKERHHL